MKNKNKSEIEIEAKATKDKHQIGCDNKSSISLMCLGMVISLFGLQVQALHCSNPCLGSQQG